MSTPYYPQSNGHAEAAVKVLKNLINKTTQDGNLETDEFLEGLIELRNTPRQHGLSPAEVLYGHPIRTKIPMHNSLFSYRWSKMDREWDKRRSQQLLKQKSWYNITSKSLPYLNVAEEVRLQHPVDKTWYTTATIVEVGRFRNYLVKLPSGQTYWRNRRFLRRLTQRF